MELEVEKKLKNHQQWLDQINDASIFSRNVALLKDEISILSKRNQNLRTN